MIVTHKSLRSKFSLSSVFANVALSIAMLCTFGANAFAAQSSVITSNQNQPSLKSGGGNQISLTQDVDDTGENNTQKVRRVLKDAVIGKADIDSGFALRLGGGGMGGPQSGTAMSGMASVGLGINAYYGHFYQSVELVVDGIFPQTSGGQYNISAGARIKLGWAFTFKHFNLVPYALAGGRIDASIGGTAGSGTAGSGTSLYGGYEAGGGIMLNSRKMPLGIFFEATAVQYLAGVKATVSNNSGSLTTSGADLVSPRLVAGINIGC